MADPTHIARRGADLLASIRATAVGPGQLAFWWTGQHSVILKIGSTVVFVDPYLKPDERRTKPPILTPSECAEFDLFVCTHDHSDHIDPWAIPQLAAQTRALFVAPAAARERMLSLGVPEDRLVTVNAEETISLCGIEITAVKAAHEFFDLTPEGFYPFLGYLLCGNGARAYHAGDTVWWEGLQETLRGLLPIDVAFVPINGRDAPRYQRGCLGNMTFAEAADLVAPLPVGLAVPTHFDMFVSNSEEPTKFTDYVAAKYPDQPTWLGPAGEPVVVSAGV